MAQIECPICDSTATAASAGSDVVRYSAALGALNAPQGAAIPESHRTAEPLRTLPYRRAS